MEVDAEILEPLQLHFSDLLLLSSASSSSSLEESERLKDISRAVMEVLGPAGPGLLAITGMPKAVGLRKTLLPFARKLALLNNEDRSWVLREHSLGSDVPLKNLDRSVSSFALQMKYVRSPSSELLCGESGHRHECRHILAKQEPAKMDGSHEFQESEFIKLGNAFKELGFCMMEIGLRLAQVCDKAIGGIELEQTILDSCTAKGRLIHYHAAMDHLILKGARRTKGSTNVSTTSFPLHHGSTDSAKNIQVKSGNENEYEMPVEGLTLETETGGFRSCRTSVSNLWQQWHYDYGIFTVLTTPMFLSSCHPPTLKLKQDSSVSCVHECSPPDGHTYLQIFDPNKNKILVVRSSPESFIVQVGESADILSKGNLRSTLHSVCRPVEQENLSRESFVVFLQPPWSKTFTMSDHSTAGARRREKLTLSGLTSGAFDGKVQLNSDATQTYLIDQESLNISQEIHRMVPPLSSRLEDGMTFAEFSRETTKQYYGTSGMQAKNRRKVSFTYSQIRNS